jgi:hypothetical protein
MSTCYPHVYLMTPVYSLLPLPVDPNLIPPPSVYLLSPISAFGSNRQSERSLPFSRQELVGCRVELLRGHVHGLLHLAGGGPNELGVAVLAQALLA